MTEQLGNAVDIHPGGVVRDNKVKRLIAIGVIIICVILLGFILFAASHFKRQQIEESGGSVIIITLLLIVFIIISLTDIARFTNNIELVGIISERNVLNAKIDLQEDPNIFDTLRLNLNHLSEYYSINKSQAKSSFNVSLSAIILGFVTIIAGILLFYVDAQRNVNLTFLTGTSGLLLEFIGGAYFFMYKKSLEQVNFFFAQLINVQDTMLAISLAENMSDDNRKMDIKEKIVLSLLERSLKRIGN